MYTQKLNCCSRKPEEPIRISCGTSSGHSTITHLPRNSPSRPCCLTKTETETDTERQTDTQADRLTDKQTDRQTDRQTDGQTQID